LLNFIFGQLAKINLRCAGARLRVRARRDQAHRGCHLVTSSGEQAQHACGVFCIAWLAQNISVHHDDGVRAEYVLLWIVLGHSLRLLLRQAQRVFERRLARELVLIDMRSMHLKCDPRCAQ